MTNVPEPRPLLRNTAIVTVLTIVAQAVALGSQLAFASIFGATGETDAYFAALVLPLYVYAVVMSPLGVVFIPILVRYRRTGRPEDAVDVASGAINLAALVLAVCAVAGVMWAGPLVSWSAPGLSPAGHKLATQLAMILWPSVLGLGLFAMLTELWQVEARFLWSAAVPIAGALVNLVLVVVLGTWIGLTGVAVAWTVSIFVQVLLVAPIALHRWRPALSWSHPGIQALMVAVFPLLGANLFIRGVTVVERYLGSLLPEGELSQVSYASRIVTTLGVFLSGGIAAVIFPRMAEEVAAGDYDALRDTTARGFRSLWLLVAPVLAFVVVLAEPFVRVLFEHGAFSRSDSAAVAALLRVYAFALVGITLAPLAARALFALRATRFLAVIGTADTLTYAAYTSVLARGVGALGIAIGFVAHALFSLVAYTLYIRRATHASGGRTFRSFASTTAMAAVAGLGAWVGTSVTAEPLAACAAGSVAGIATYGLALAVSRPPELAAVLRALSPLLGRGMPT